MTKVAINGFGRIGRLAFRQMFEAEGYEVVAINPASSVRVSTLLTAPTILSSSMVRKLLFMLCLTLLSCLGASWVLM